MKELGRTEGSLRSRARRLKLTSDIKLWTEENDNYLKENWGVLPTKELMKKLGRSKYAVETRAIKTLKLAKKTISYWSKEEDDYLKENVNKLSRDEIAKKVGRSVSGVVSRIHHLKLLSDPVYTNERNERPPVLPVGENEGQNVPVNGNEALFLNWIEKNNISEFEVDDFVTQCKITEGLAEKIITHQIHRGYVNQMGQNTFLVNKSKKYSQIFK